ncbi:MAG: hypothetical protein FWB93_02180 [Oscillospiraceae bacterium]|nr:hypothetical protein [Oscillospiraceae bacterium]
MKKSKQYRKLEKELSQKYKNVKENEVTLEKDDFKDGKLTVFGYDRLKNQCDYIPYSETIELAVPQAFEANFRASLEFMIANELSRIRKDRREARRTSLILLLGGIFCFVLAIAFEFRDILLAENLVVIASWVFVWASVEKWFFDRKELQEKRKSLLQILSARISIYR